MTLSVYGSASEPRTLTRRPSSTVTVRLQVSGQSRVQTLARSTRVMAGLRADSIVGKLARGSRVSECGGAALRFTYSHAGHQGKMVRPYNSGWITPPEPSLTSPRFSGAKT